jgi:hypothetical protein
MSDTPAPNAFIGRTSRPSNADLESALGRAKPVWDQLIADLASEHDVTIQEWRNYSVKAGWALRLKRGKRTIVWLAPFAGSFQVAFIFGDRAVLAARESRLSARVLHMLDSAPRYPEGTALRLQIKSARDLALVRKLALLKLQN